MATENELRRALSQGLASWLTFEHHAGRSELFSERYLALPIAQIIRTHCSGTVIAEHNHPVLATPGRRGRPPQLDFVIEENDKIALVIESKWAGDRGVSVSDVVWDCVRLELAAHHYSCPALFVLAGTRSQVDRVLASPSFNPRTSRRKRTPVLGLGGHGRASVNVQSPKRAFGPPLHKVFKDFPDVRWPRSFVCGQGTQSPGEPATSRYTAVVWHIRPEAPIKRYTFVAQTSAPQTLLRQGQQVEVLR